MSIDLGISGVPGYGYGSPLQQQTQSEPAEPAQNEDRPAAVSETLAEPEAVAAAAPETVGPASGTVSGTSQNGSANGSAGYEEPNAGAEAETGADEPAEEVGSQRLHDQIPGLEPSASDCMKRAQQIAQSLNHSDLSTDHLMLALTMDSSARRLLERVGDVTQLREAAMQRLGKNHTRAMRDQGDQLPVPTAELTDLGKTAREAANEREQLIAISDLINAFPKVDGRLAYGSENRQVAVAETIEKSIVPRVYEAAKTIEVAVLDALQRQHQTVQSLLQDLRASRPAGEEQRRREFMDEIRRQVRDAADTQIAAALKGFNATLDAKIAELKAPVVEAKTSSDVIESEIITDPVKKEEAADEAVRKSVGRWNWLGIL